MARYFAWDEPMPKTGGKGGGGNGSGIEFLKLETGKKYKVRLVAKPFQYFQHWDPVICRSPEVDENGKTIDPLMLAGIMPKQRYSIWVLDRNDGNKLKVIDFPLSMLEQFKNWKENFSDDPGGPKGPDWILEGKCPGSDKRKTKWTCLNMDRTPFTEDEIKAIKGGDLQKKLEDARRPHTPDEIREMIAAKNGGAPAAEQKAPAAPPAAASSDKDFNF